MFVPVLQRSWVQIPLKPAIFQALIATAYNKLMHALVSFSSVCTAGDVLHLELSVFSLARPVRTEPVVASLPQKRNEPQKLDALTGYFLTGNRVYSRVWLCGISTNPKKICMKFTLVCQMGRTNTSLLLSQLPFSSSFVLLWRFVFCTFLSCF